ncbi:F-box/kelch-repeat protein At3g23880-like [Solanum stenotomum]|uniref:F-box/kelch-repeat protein At3g23880-like n=1 Tax=Solanum stenotomum TaxID=172797 RepID=UPI0020D11C33|nr:F-box/kelch-repeat protein At3g23880-like [Solanum stenotomum]
MNGRSKIPNLPEDIVNCILLELPVKSLSRFKSCCKSWRCSIDDADFIKFHLHKSSVDTSRQKFVFLNVNPQGETRQYKIVSIEASISGDSKFVYLDEPNIPGFCSNYKYIEVLSCSGLVFMMAYDPGYNMTLWNPAVGKYYKLIPNSLLSQKYFNPFSTSPVFGFAYDFVAEDYKVLCVHLYLKNDSLRHPRYFVEVYSVKNQCWRTIHNIFPGPSDPLPPHIYHDQVSLNGVIHRIAYNWTIHMIISFHLADEKFIVTPVPSTCGIKPTLYALGDRVCVLATVGEEILIWSPEKDSKTVWNCINKFPTLVSLIGKPSHSLSFAGNFMCVKDNGNILWRKLEGPFIEYDVRKNEYTEFKVTQVGDFIAKKALYVESLVSLKIPWD